MSKEIIDFYTDGYTEDDRLKRRILELERSKVIISRYLTRPGMKIADIGCAAGTYSVWLSKMGHEVHALDLVERHIDQAKENAKKENTTISSFTCGNALELPYSDNTFDIVLQMGSLYHLQNKKDRLKVLEETKRVLRPGGVAICAVISRFATLLDGFKNSFIDDDKYLEILNECLISGKHNGMDTDYFTTSYMHMPNEIGEEMKTSGFSDIKTIAIEGWFSFGVDGDEMMKDENKRRLILEYLEKIECEPSLMGASDHIMTVGVK